ncbi:glycosyltransferase family 4 protein [Clostridium algidicarnis]|uniref:glycosyltransferase family 4 protein n=1 Tax=Clostridium algidicarnis TaxID=37659 RepID=UPI001C0B01CA|nr:glycosyltransferase family 1 protein [Clostridium algidicarnis]MBU3228586.1 glycosyltransferase family 4 protein [Clostridium algidicarnis]MBU3251937.1 glycosyltransferase family 4 protein [Clostridium algidicarnis]
MKVCIDGRAAKWYRGTGIGTYTYQLIKSLNNIDGINEYTIFMPKANKIPINLNTNLKINTIKDSREKGFWNQVNIPNILDDVSADIYHIPQNGVGMPKKKNCKFVITLHDVIPLRMPETVGERYLKIFNEEMKSIVSLCDGIITVSEFSKEDISKAFNFPKDKIYVTPLASEDIYKPLNKDLCKHNIEHFYNIKGDFILYIGGFSPRKNIIGLLEAFHKVLKTNNPNLKLIIGGNKGLSYEIYKNKALELGIEDKVVFPGFIPLEHLPWFYNACDFFVYPSLYEGFGLPPLEAMACGSPVIASNLTSIPEVLGDSALLIDPRSGDDLYNAMNSLLINKDLKQDLILKGLKRNSIFNWETTAKETLLAYENICK